MRPGSGTFLAEARIAAPSQPPTSQLVLCVNRVRAEAAALGIDSRHFSRFLHYCLDEGLRDLPVAIAECNREQVGVFSHELRALLGVRPRPALLEDLKARGREVLSGVAGVVTTDFHRAEVAELVAPVGLPVYRISLDPNFSRAILERARVVPVVMIVSDASFAPRFLRFAADAAGRPDIVKRFTIVEAAAAREVLRSLPAGAAIYVSPLVEEEVAPRIPAGVERIVVRRHIGSASVERLRARLAYDLVSAETGRRLTARD